MNICSATFQETQKNDRIFIAIAAIKILANEISADSGKHRRTALITHQLTESYDLSASQYTKIYVQTKRSQEVNRDVRQIRTHARRQGDAGRRRQGRRAPLTTGWKSSIADETVALVNKRLFAVFHALTDGSRFVCLRVFSDLFWW